MLRCRDYVGALALALVAVVLFARVRPSDAQAIAGPPLNAQAQAHFDKALAAYSAANYHAASVEFELAYNVDARRELLFAWAQAERLAGNCDRAVVLYRRFLDQGPSPEEAAKAGRQIERCRGPAAQAPAAGTPSPASSYTSGSEPRPVHWYSDPWADALVVAGMVAGITGGAFVGLASSDDSAADSATQYGVFRQLAEDADRHRLIGSVALGSGAVLVTSGVLVYFWHGRSDESVVARRWSPTLGLGSVGVAGAF